jgi:hypothetical protein
VRRAAAADEKDMKARLYLMLGLVACALSPAAVQAQSFSFSIGHGHHHGHHHHGWHHHHHCWDDPFWCGPHFGYYYAPPPIVQREIRYVQPVERVIEAPRPVALPQSANLASSTRQPLQIWNSAGRKVPVAFVVDGQEVTLQDGQSHTFYGGGARLVEFDRGGSFGTARRSLAGSEYEFVITSSGWDLVRRGEAAASVSQRAAPRNELPR